MVKRVFFVSLSSSLSPPFSTSPPSLSAGRQDAMMMIGNEKKKVVQKIPIIIVVFFLSALRKKAFDAQNVRLAAHCRIPANLFSPHPRKELGCKWTKEKWTKESDWCRLLAVSTPRLAS